jgi:hypothetical protein
VNVPYWIGALVLAIIIVGILAALEAWSPWRNEMGNDVDGDLSGAPLYGSANVRIQPAE